MNKKAFVFIPIIIAILMILGVAFASWRLVSDLNGETQGNFNSYTIINLDDTTTTDTSSIFLYNDAGFAVNNSYSETVTFELTFTVSEKEQYYNLLIDLDDEDDFLFHSYAAVSSTYSYNETSINGDSSLSISNMKDEQTFSVRYTIDVTDYYSEFYSYLYTQEKKLNIIVTSSTEDGNWTSIKKNSFSSYALRIL